jgi:hypothetical protein
MAQVSSGYQQHVLDARHHSRVGGVCSDDRVTAAAADAQPLGLHAGKKARPPTTMQLTVCWFMLACVARRPRHGC